MSDIESINWSETAANNNAAVPNGAPEGWAPSTVNDVQREVMAAGKREWNRSHPTVTSGGSANAQTLSYPVNPSGLVQGQMYSFIAGFTNTGPATLQVGSLPATAIKMDNAALVGGEIQAGLVVVVMCDGSVYQVVSARALATQPAKNWLINGGMEVWQRGAGGTASISVSAASAAYTADRWVLSTGANEACTVSQQAGLVSGSRYCLRLQRNSGQTGTGTMTFEQPLTFDQVAALRGQIVTISCKARSGVNWSPTSGALVFSLNVGTGASEARNASLTGLSQVATVTTNLGTSSSVTTISVTGASVVPASTVQGSLLFTFTPSGTAGSNDYVEIDDVSLTITPVATAFERRRFDEEVAACRLFYQKSLPYAVAPTQNVGSATGAAFSRVPGGASGTFGQQISFGVVMRAAPSITTFNPLAANANWRDISVGADRTVQLQTPSAGSVQIEGLSGVSGSENVVHWQADAEI